MLTRNYYTHALVILFLFIGIEQSFAQNVIWIEDFDDGGGGRWTLENAPGSLTNPTPLGIVGLTYGTNAAVAHDNFVINDRNTPELDNDIVVGVDINAQGQFVQGRHYDCPAPSNLPNPFVNGAQPGPNQSLHITAYPTCATLLYAGTAQSDDWNCISDPDNGDVQTQTEQIAFLNNNVDATGQCNLMLTADFFLGGDSDGIKSHGTILYSVDAGVTWQVLKDSLSSCSPFLAGTCNNWFRRSFPFPADANNQNDLRIAFRWYDDGDIENTGDYALGASFNVDNVMISGCSVPSATFNANQLLGCKGDVIHFTDQSTTTDGLYSNCLNILSGSCPITSWSWSVAGPVGGHTFVNATTSSSQDPEIQFTLNGTYSITLTASNCAGGGVHTETNMITIADCPPSANFFASQLSACADPASSQDTVSFTDLSQGTGFSPITSWAWTITPATVTFVNGTNASSQNIDLTFDAIGTYEIELTVTSTEGSDTETKTAYIEALDCNCGGGGGPSFLWTEDFDGNGGAGSNWTTAPLNQSVGAQGADANLWYISDQENGNAATQCGSAGGGDNSLHVSSSTIGDIGAAYDAGCWTGCVWCDGFGICSNTSTNKRSFSQNINTTGFSGLTLNFNFIENGEGADDDCIFEYSIDGGATWLTLDNPAKPPLGACAPQGTWTAYSFALPATCDNNPNLRIGFRWINDADGNGADPSFAVDDITITGGGGGATANTWEGTTSADWNTAANWSDNAVPTSADDVLVPASGNLVGTFMPQIGAAAFARDVCNFGVITLNGDNTLTIDRDLLNEGEITTTTTNANADVIFANTASVYKGSGTLYDTDVSVASSDLTLETNMWPRSMTVATTGTFDIDVYTLSVNRNLSKSSGLFTAVNGEVHFIDACGACLDQANTSDVSIDANQIFGNVLVNKTTGIKVSLLSAFNYTLNTPKTLTIQSGILDANTFTLNGTGNLTMTGGELQLAKCTTILPELTGTYTLPAGKIRFDGACAQTVKQTSVVGTDYFKVQFDGSGIKSLNGNTVVSDSLLFTLPTGLGNYVNAGTDTLFVTNNSSTIVGHSGGHVVGNYNRTFTPSGGVYTFHVGSDNSDGETYFEPIRFTPNVLTGNSGVTVRFLDLTPNPTVVVPSIIFGFPLATDTVENVETEGYWHMGVENAVLGGNYTASVSPDINYWTFAHPWGTDGHTLLKQDIEGDNWDYTIGGSRVNDSTTQTFNNFSNYALGYTNNGSLALAVDLLGFNVYCDEGRTYFAWSTVAEEFSHSFMIERTENGEDYELVGVVPAAGTSNELIEYQFKAEQRLTPGYYRLREMDMNGILADHGSIYVDCSESQKDLELVVSPNPNTGIFYVNVFALNGEQGSITIHDMTGKTIFMDDSIQFKKGYNVSSLHIDAESGVYMLTVRKGNKFVVERIVIQ